MPTADTGEDATLDPESLFHSSIRAHILVAGSSWLSEYIDDRRRSQMLATAVELLRPILDLARSPEKQIDGLLSTARPIWYDATMMMAEIGRVRCDYESAATHYRLAMRCWEDLSRDQHAIIAGCLAYVASLDGQYEVATAAISLCPENEGQAAALATAAALHLQASGEPIEPPSDPFHYLVL